jgi:hypothetical protein
MAFDQPLGEWQQVGEGKKTMFFSKAFDRAKHAGG